MENPELIHATYITSVNSRLMLLLDRVKGANAYGVFIRRLRLFLTVTPDNTLSVAPSHAFTSLRVVFAWAQPHTSD